MMLTGTNANPDIAPQPPAMHVIICDLLNFIFHDGKSFDECDDADLSYIG